MSGNASLHTYNLTRGKFCEQAVNIYIVHILVTSFNDICVKRSIATHGKSTSVMLLHVYMHILVS